MNHSLAKFINVPPDIKKYNNVFQKAKNLAVMKVFKEKTLGNSLAVQWIEFHASTEGETIGELRSYMPNAWHGQNKQTNVLILWYFATKQPKQFLSFWHQNTSSQVRVIHPSESSQANSHFIKPVSTAGWLFLIL